MMRRSVKLFSVVAVTVCLGNIAGCAKGPAIVEGVVTLDGQPVAGALVTFVLDGADGEAPMGQTDATGAFRVPVFPGNYKVLVEKKEVGPNMLKSVLPEKYTDFANTPLTASIPVKQPLELRLTRK